MLHKSLGSEFGGVLLVLAIAGPAQAATEQREVKVQAAAPGAVAYSPAMIAIPVVATYQGEPVSFQPSNYLIESLVSPQGQCAVQVVRVAQVPSSVLAGTPPGASVSNTILYVRPRQPLTGESCSGAWKPGKTLVRLAIRAFQASGSGPIQPPALLYEGSEVVTVEAR